MSSTVTKEHVGLCNLFPFKGLQSPNYSKVVNQEKVQYKTGHHSLAKKNTQNSKTKKKKNKMSDCAGRQPLSAGDEGVASLSAPPMLSLHCVQTEHQPP